MSTITDVQRKHIRQRLTELKKSKQVEINSKYQAVPNREYKNSEEFTHRKDYILSELKRVGLDWTFNEWGELVTPRDRERLEKIELVAELRISKSKELTTLFDSLLDEVMLGTDTEELSRVLAALNDFKID